MLISMISNVLNIVGNAILIWIFHMGVAGAAIATLVSRIFCAVVVLIQLRKDRQPIVVRDCTNPPGLGDDKEDTWDWNSVRCGK